MVFPFCRRQKIFCIVLPSGLASVRGRVAAVLVFVKIVGSVKDDFKSSVGDMNATHTF